ncbi:DUF2125 domain-containing protein [Sagittula sp. SSi028]|uniref:DUF2125 domain-containing protein n=1 Tax=Sagittula sp. SSi028 TaxID=3400636 RepID=UPI003AF55EE6
MKRYVAVVLAAALIWSGYWFVQAQALRGSIEDWFDARRAEGWTAAYDDLTVRGFPSRLDVTITQPDIRDPDSGTGWQTPFVQILGLSYRRDHVILAFADTQRIITAEHDLQIASDGLRASLVEEDDVIARLNVEARTLNITGAEAQIALAQPLLNFHRTTGTQYRLAASSTGIAAPQSGLNGGGSDALTLQLLTEFAQPWTLDALSGDRPAPRAVDIVQASYRHAELELDLSGGVTADAEGRMDGEIALRAVNWKALLDQARDIGTLPDALADPLEDALTLAAGLSGQRDTLDVPLTFRRGAMFFGMIPLGQAPRLQWP